MSMACSSPFVLHAIAAYERAFKLMEQTLAETRAVAARQQADARRRQPDAVAARLSYLGLLEAWTAGRPRINDWWARVQEWPSFRRGCTT